MHVMYVCVCVLYVCLQLQFLHYAVRNMINVGSYLLTFPFDVTIVKFRAVQVINPVI